MTDRDVTWGIFLASGIILTVLGYAEESNIFCYLGGVGIGISFKYI